ncbi:Gfo/Idh/MocA family oxidoreductase [Fibrella sp. HMF5335]|uniref:Gfo/Idh/MocA family oxidoreductase n=1 Tax=Fibrella rubiginis TaxID=2817060 RepID=A0A939GHJ4_9BACT|nr:Gfo/Idh/MocA family oxidoreductase [Fibrella rubiginis]MBO0938446.1 Gfo/Idh/MocA family oxidoreductase [Fibrella rubiginis]
MHQRPSRRLFLRTATLATTLVPTLSAWIPTSARPTNTASLRLGILGTGSRGQQAIRQALNFPGVQISAICDTNPDAVRQALSLFTALGQPRPVVYAEGESAFQQLLRRDDIDGVVIAASGNWQVPMAIAAMKAGKYAGLTVSTPTTVRESQRLVDTFEQTGTPLMFLERTCYHPDTLAVLNQIRQGDFGEITHARSGYQQPGASSAPYPTHGLGPVAQWLNINRGNRFVSLSSTMTKSRGLVALSPKSSTAGSLSADYTLGNVITTIIQCASGAVVELIHDSETPRPYAAGFRVQGTAGGWTGGEHNSPKDQTSADSLMMRDFVESVRNRTAPPINAYDAALWSCIHSLAEQSLAAGGQAVAIPDFTSRSVQPPAHPDSVAYGPETCGAGRSCG